jgi:ATP-independent RNA helicase DbpA
MNFNKLNLSKECVNNLNNMGFSEATAIQKESIPHILNKKNIIAKAQTGSGKTVSFCLGVDNNLHVKKFRVQSLILAPTRELAEQIAIVLKSIVKYRHNIKILTLCGGVPYKPQVRSLFHQAHIIVGTPGRVLKHLREENLSLKDVNTFVLDEADKMLDMGFSEDIDSIINYLPKQNIQSMLFSATFDETLISNDIFSNCHKIEIQSQKPKIDEYFYEIETDLKTKIIPKLLSKDFEKVIIFCNTKISCEELANELENMFDLEVLVLNSNLEQIDRTETLIMFENGTFPILIATDIASRGLDIDDVDLVINYELPNNDEVYIHRIGRTARASKTGISISLADDTSRLKEIQDYLQKDLTLSSIDTILDKDQEIIQAQYETIYINGGKKDKVRKTDLLGALSKDIGIDFKSIGKIDILPKGSYIALRKDTFDKFFKNKRDIKIKSKFYRIYKIS